MAAIRAAQSIPPEKFPEKSRHWSIRPTEAEFRRFREIENAATSRRKCWVTTPRSLHRNPCWATWPAIGTNTRRN